MNNDYIQLSFKTYECVDCGSIVLIFDDEVGVCDNCGGNLMEVEEEENE